MGKRFLLLGVTLTLIALLVYPSLKAETASAVDLFYWLGAGLVACAIALWPRSGRDRRAEMRLERAGWADRVTIVEPAEDDGGKVLALRSARSRSKRGA